MKLLFGPVAIGRSTTDASARARVAALGLALIVGCGGADAPSDQSTQQMDAGAGADAQPSGGLAWSARPSIAGTDLRTIWGSGTDIYAAGVGPEVAHSDDSGATWATSSTGLAAAAGWPKLHHIAGSSDSDVWIAGQADETSAALLHSIDHGQTWQSVAVPGAHNLEAAWAPDPQHVIVADHDGDLFSSADGGASFSRSSIGGGVVLFSLWGSADAKALYAVGGRVSSAPDAGTLMFADDTDAGLVGEGDASLAGAMFRSDDGGQTWTEIDVTPAGPLWNVSGTPDGREVYAAGGGASVAWTVDNGATWTARSRLGSSPDYDLTDVWVAPGDAAVFFTSSKGVVIDIQFNDSGSAQFRYEGVPPGDDGTQETFALWGRGSADVWAVGPGGTLRHRP